MSMYNPQLTVTRTSTGAQFAIGSDKITGLYALSAIPSNTILSGPSALTTNSITAHAGGGQGSAVLLTTIYNIVTVCATAADSVKLPVASVNTYFIIQNNGAAALSVYPATSGTINGGSANASVSVAVGGQLMLVGSSVLNWNTYYPSVISYYDNAATVRKHIVNEPVSLIANQSQSLISVTNSLGGVSYITPNKIEQYFPFFTALSGAASLTTATITAHAGGGQGSAVALSTQYNIVTTCATAGDSVKLPTATAGAVYIVLNSGATQLAIFPATSGTINGGAVNTSVLLNIGEQVIFTGSSTTNWITSNPIQTKIDYNNPDTNTSVYLDVQESSTTLATKIAAVANQVESALVPAAINATATATAAQVAGGYITSSSAAATTITMPTGALLGNLVGAFAGMTMNLIVDNTGGASAVTMAIGTNAVLSDWTNQLTTATASITPAAVTPLTITYGVSGIAKYLIMFSSPTAYAFSRIA